MLSQKDIDDINKEIAVVKANSSDYVSKFFYLINKAAIGRNLYFIAAIKPVEKIEQVDLSFRNKKFGSFEGEFVLFNF